MAFSSMTVSRTAPVAATGTTSEAVRTPCSSSRQEVKSKASPLKEALRKPLRCVKAAAASVAAQVQPRVKEPTLEVDITDLLHPAAFRLPANPLDLDISFRPPSRAWALACAKKGGRLPGRWEIELEEKLLAVHNYGTGLFQNMPDHLARQWGAADALMDCHTPTQLAHAIAARFPHSTYAEMVQPEQRKQPSPTTAPACSDAKSCDASPVLDYAVSTRYVSVCPISGSVRTLDYVPLTRSISSCHSSPSAPPTPQRSTRSPPAIPQRSTSSAQPTPQQPSNSPPATPQDATSSSPANPLRSSSSPPAAQQPATSSPPATPQHATTSPPSTPQSSCSPPAARQPTTSRSGPHTDGSPSSAASQAGGSTRATPQWRQRTASGLEVDVSPVPWGSRSRFAEMRAGGCISPPAAHPSFWGRRAPVVCA